MTLGLTIPTPLLTLPCSPSPTRCSSSSVLFTNFAANAQVAKWHFTDPAGQLSTVAA